MNVKRLICGALTSAALLLAVSCSASAQDFKGEAEKLITESLQKDIGLGDLKAVCEKPANETPAVGDTFACTATTADGGVINLTATVDKPKHFELATTNLVLSTNLPDIKTAVATSLTEQVGTELSVDEVDCGATSVILDETLSMVCGLTDPATGDVYDTTLTFTDVSTGQFDILVADAPRG